jgi:glutathione S-transferase
MKLYWSPTSPYTRKVRAIIIEKGLSDKVESVQVDVWGDAGTLHGDNPLGKIPCLVGDEGLALYDSPVICAYLDAHPAGTGPALYPASGEPRWRVMKAEALADGIMDNAVGMVVEKRKPADERSPWMERRWTVALDRAYDAIMPELSALPAGFTMGHLAMAVALAYMDFRHPHIAWRDGRPELTAWYDSVKDRPSLAQTVPAVWREAEKLA